MFLSRQLQEIIFSKKPLSMFLLLLKVAFCTAMTKNDVKFCQHVSQYEEKEYMIDLGVVTPSGSISIPFVLYMGGGGGGGGEGRGLCNLFTGLTCIYDF